MEQIDSQTLHSKILLPYETRSDEAWEAYRLAKQFGKKAEQVATKQAWHRALDIAVAVDEALATYRAQAKKAGE
jgi:hypothetical protein